MKRIVVALAVLVGAAAGAYAQETLKQEDPVRTDVVQIGVLYTGSICRDDHNPGYNDFSFRVIRDLERGWVEADYGYMSREYGRIVFRTSDKSLRLNLDHMCSIRVQPLAD